MIPPIIGFEIPGQKVYLSLCRNLKMLFQSCQTATKSFLLQNSLMGVGVEEIPGQGEGMGGNGGARPLVARHAQLLDDLVVEGPEGIGEHAHGLFGVLLQPPLVLDDLVCHP